MNRYQKYLKKIRDAQRDEINPDVEISIKITPENIEIMKKPTIFGEERPILEFDSIEDLERKIKKINNES